jgi:hypothetical protein
MVILSILSCVHKEFKKKMVLGSLYTVIAKTGLLLEQLLQPYLNGYLEYKQHICVNLITIQVVFLITVSEWLFRIQTTHFVLYS